jgi:exopolysaccharide biosynthesis polyprenyl glycosylphosphotransferase
MFLVIGLVKMLKVVTGGQRSLPLDVNPEKWSFLKCDIQPKDVSYRYAKRTLDILVSTILLLILFPIFAAIAIVIRLTSPGPIFYKSYRVGLCGQPFIFIKFRTMCVDAEKKLDQLRQLNEKEGPIFKMREDPRVTPIGRFLRKYSLDELPQLINVLLGSMTLVGPRPAIPGEVSQYNERTLQRLIVTPGITCYWQIMGRSNLTFEQWIELDLKYIQEMSFWTDLKILLKTPAAVIRGEGAY